MLETLEQIGSLLVVGQIVLLAPALARLYLDKRVAGMSIWTMGFYCFASLYYVPVFWLAGMPATALTVLLLGLVELAWCWMALVYRRRGYA